jgi:hypothetical protein
MKNKALKITAALLALLCVLGALSACRKKTPAVSGLGVIHEPEFGGVYIKITIDDFNAKGFEYGDSVKLEFSNGYVLDDLPYYNGYYTLTGSPLLIAYPGYDYVKAAINNSDDLWVVAGLKDTDTASVTLCESGKYAAIQNARNISYYDERERFESDEVFANFRNITVGSIKPGVVYRSASPCDNQHNRATYTDALMRQAGVRCILDLADSDEKIQKYIGSDGFACNNFLAIYNDGGVIPLALNMNYSSAEFKAKVADGLVKMTGKDGPYLIHCTEGKDRTGFVCLLIEALCGAGYDEIVHDYMITYDNYYQITKEKDKERYDVIVESVLDPMIAAVAGEGVDIKTADLSACAVNFLKDAGMSEAQIGSLKAKLTE